MSSQELIEQGYAFMNLISSENYEEVEWKNLLNEIAIDGLQSVSLIECHVVDYIGNNRLTNATGIVKSTGVTKGGISKITARLLQKNLIEACRMEGNGKEVFYQLTPNGKLLFDLHQKLHADVYAKLKQVVDSYTPEEQQILSRFLRDLQAII